MSSTCVKIAYQSFTGDYSEIGSDKVATMNQSPQSIYKLFILYLYQAICPKCYARIRKVLRIKTDDGKYAWLPVNPPSAQSNTSEDSAPEEVNYSNSMSSEAANRSFDMAVTTEFLQRVSIPNASSTPNESFESYEEVSSFPLIEEFENCPMLEESEERESVSHSFQLLDASEVQVPDCSKLESQIASSVSQLFSQPMSQVASSVSQPMSQIASSTSQPMSQIASSTSQPMSQVASSVSQPMSQIASSVSQPMSQIASSVSQPMSQIASSTSQPMSQITSSFSQPFSEPTSQVSNSSVFRLKLASITFTQSCCFICKSSNGRGMVPKPAIKQAYTHLEIFIPSSTRCCRHHLNRENRFYPEVLDKIESTKTEIDVSSSDFGDWLMTISTDYTVKTSKYISFEEGGVNESSYRMLTGLEKKDFDTLYHLTVAG